MTQGNFMLMEDVLKYIPTLEPNLLIKYKVGSKVYYNSQHVAETMTRQEFITMECYVPTLMLINNSK